MGEKDISEKLLEDYDDVFADIVNVLLFGGERLIKETELVNLKARSQYKADGALHEQERDVIKLWQNCELRLAVLGCSRVILNLWQIISYRCGRTGIIYHRKKPSIMWMRY